MATLAYDYRAGVVWLLPLADEDHPATHDLCARHADRLSVPTGWRLDDRRRTPGADERPATVATGPARTGAP